MKTSILLSYDKYERLIKLNRQPYQPQEHQRETLITEEVEQDGGVRFHSEHILDAMPQRYKYKKLEL